MSNKISLFILFAAVCVVLVCNASATVASEKNESKDKREMKLEEIQREFQNQILTVAQPGPGFIFNPGEKPKIVWGDPDRVRELIGNAPLTVRWFDADFNEVAVLNKPGRYAAYIESKMLDGTPIRRILSFYCKPPDVVLDSRMGTETQIPFIENATSPVIENATSPEIWKKHIGEIRKLSDWIFRQGAFNTELGAMFLAGLSEIKAVDFDSIDLRNFDYQLALKLKLMGLSNKVKPLAPPRQRTGSLPKQK
jgi:hypothetical protein